LNRSRNSRYDNDDAKLETAQLSGSAHN
jgi:hypothetical protein